MMIVRPVIFVCERAAGICIINNGKQILKQIITSNWILVTGKLSADERM